MSHGWFLFISKRDCVPSIPERSSNFRRRLLECEQLTALVQRLNRWNDVPAYTPAPCSWQGQLLAKIIDNVLLHCKSGTTVETSAAQCHSWSGVGHDAIRQNRFTLEEQVQFDDTTFKANQNYPKCPLQKLHVGRAPGSHQPDSVRLVYW